MKWQSPATVNHRHDCYDNHHKTGRTPNPRPEHARPDTGKNAVATLCAILY